VGLPNHEPFVVVNVCPCCGVPLIIGAAVLTGAAGGAALTVCVGLEVAVVEPPAFVAVTATAMVWPISPEATV
jgi:hypothetical protein